MTRHMKHKRRGWLAALRAYRGWTQAETAAKLEIPQTTYASYETGARAYPYEAALAMVEVFGGTIDDYWVEGQARTL